MRYTVQYTCYPCRVPVSDPPSLSTYYNVYNLCPGCRQAGRQLSSSSLASKKGQGSGVGAHRGRNFSHSWRPTTSLWSAWQAPAFGSTALGGNMGWHDKTNGATALARLVYVYICVCVCICKRIVEVWQEERSLRLEGSWEADLQQQRDDFGPVFGEIFGHHRLRSSECLQVQVVTCWHPPVFLY